MSWLGAVGEGLAELALGPERDSQSLGFGGDAANVCVMASRLGTPSRLLGRVGCDGLGARLRSFWTEQGLDLSPLRSDPDAATGLYVNETLPDGSHEFAYWRRGSAGSRLSGDDLRPSFYEDLGVLVFTGITLAVSSSSAQACRQAIAEAGSRGIRIACVLNHRPALRGDPTELAELAERSELVVGSRADLAAIYGNAGEGYRRLSRRAPGRELAITDGTRAASVAFADQVVSQPVPEVEAANAAGAGDAFAGAYLAGRLQGTSIVAAMRQAVAAATLSVTRAGCARSYPTARETAAAVEELPEPTSAGTTPAALAV